ncbi:MAG: hypothetical protein EB127_16170 [Alphaproteobacteria bacterium]|nr:hypothetical protein [Alphaproteobacteria bacterium]
MSRTTSFFERENHNLTFWYIISFLLGILCFFYLWDDLRSAGNYNISNYWIVFTVLSIAFVVLALFGSNLIIPKPTLNQTYEFKDEDAEPTLVGEHSQDMKNSCVSFKVGNGITSFFLKLVVSFIIGYLAAQIRSSNNFTELLTEIKDVEIEGQISKIKPTPFGSQITLTNIVN